MVRYVGGTLGALLLSLLLLTGCGQAPAAPDVDEGDPAILEEEGAPGTMAEEEAGDNTLDEEATEPATDEEATEPAADEIRVPEGDIEEFWNGFDWADLTAAEQEAWAVLGWDEESWDEETTIPESEEATWDELTEEEQEAAESLGYEQENWDATAPEE
jgi:hypothetical protein